MEGIVRSSQNIYQKDRPGTVDIDRSVICTGLKAIQPITVKLVSRTAQEWMWDYLVKEYHYLGHRNMVGCNLKYLAYSNKDQVVAALGWRAAALKIAVRDAFIGWSAEQRKAHLRQIANGNRFLIPPWVKVYSLASHVLSRNIAMVVRDWYRFYGSELLLLETFVDPRRFTGATYKASNWILVGKTKGYTKDGVGYRYHGERKEVYIYVINRKFRTILKCHQRPVPQMSAKVQKREGELKMVLRHEGWDKAKMELSEAEIEQLAEEVKKFHGQFTKYYRRIEQHQLGLTYICGLLSTVKRKTGEGIALRFLGETDVRYLQNHITGYRWDHEGMKEKYQQELSNLIEAEEGMWTVDSSEFRKKGRESVGVARQYCGAVGKVENCQSGVFVGYTSERGYGMVDCRLYMPQQWFEEEYEERRKKCRVPQELQFKSKVQIGLDLIEKVEKGGGFGARWVGCDATFSSSHEFLDTIGEQLYYFANVKKDTKVWLQRPEVGVGEYSGRGRPPVKRRVLEPEARALRVEDVAKRERLKWQLVKLTEGAKGPIVAEVARIRVIELRDGLPGKECWLFMRKELDGSIKYALCNAPKDISFQRLIRASTMRWSLEQCFEEGKSELGMDHYEHRSWPGWHRHMLYVFLAQLFLSTLRNRFKKNSGFDSRSSKTHGRNDSGDRKTHTSEESQNSQIPYQKEQYRL